MKRINEKSAGGKGLRGEDRIDCIDQSHDSSYTGASSLEMKRRKRRSKYEEKNETL